MAHPQLIHHSDDSVVGADLPGYLRGPHYKVATDPPTLRRRIHGTDNGSGDHSVPTGTHNLGGGGPHT